MTRARWQIRMSLAAAVVLGGCALGPDFKRPAEPVDARYLAASADSALAGAPNSQAQRFLAGIEPPREWWKSFRSDELDAAVAAALTANPGMRGAQAALRVANENVAAQRGSYWPTVAANATFTRQRDPVAVLSPTLSSGSPIFNLYTPELSVSYLPDFFGANRRAVESLAAQRDAARFELEATYETLIANVVTAIVQVAGLAEAIVATDRSIAAAREILAIDRRALALGSLAPADVYAQEAALAALEATLPGLRKQQATSRHQLAALLGRRPDEDLPSLPSLGALELPPELPLGVPSRLVARRPDVMAAEAMLHQATAQVGVATINLLPTVQLTATKGSTATSVGQLFKDANMFWSVGASLSQTLFAGGTLWHRKKAAEAALDQAGEAYRSAVLNAFQNVADALTALEQDAAAERAAAASAAAAERSFTVARRQVALGGLGGSGLLLAEQGYQTALAQEVSARSSRFADTAALFLALGGSLPEDEWRAP